MKANVLPIGSQINAGEILQYWPMHFKSKANCSKRQVVCRLPGAYPVCTEELGKCLFQERAPATSYCGYNVLSERVLEIFPAA